MLFYMKLKSDMKAMSPPKAKKKMIIANAA